MKTCITCGESKPLLAFNSRKDASDGRRNDCAACQRKRTKANYEANRGKRLADKRRPEVLARNVVSKRKMVTGFTPELFAFTRLLQGDKCAICDADLSALPSKHVHADHCHATRTPRGVLCHWCNAALGQFKDDPLRLKRALDYLEAPPAQFV